jgi:hypothetical protein
MATDRDVVRDCGKQTHDAHLVAVMEVHSVQSVLTFNVSHYRRFPNITVLNPAEIQAVSAIFRSTLVMSAAARPTAAAIERMMPGKAWFLVRSMK